VFVFFIYFNFFIEKMLWVTSYVAVGMTSPPRIQSLRSAACVRVVVGSCPGLLVAGGVVVYTQRIVWLINHDMLVGLLWEKNTAEWLVNLTDKLKRTRHFCKIKKDFFIIGGRSVVSHVLWYQKKARTSLDHGLSRIYQLWIWMKTN